MTEVLKILQNRSKKRFWEAKGPQNIAVKVIQLLFNLDLYTFNDI